MLDVDEYEAMLEQIEMLQDIQISSAQLERGNGVEHDAAKEDVLKRVGK
ncbi:MAG: hypothetical protein SRB2_02570 [Desulfobacteraceae bacterium Eth-SRB2]|nr:MAG: hypothetical protein SRB2_02570 [Desulfobacteraceae bacterium Eth-SRB2]